MTNEEINQRRLALPPPFQGYEHNVDQKTYIQMLERYSADSGLHLVQGDLWVHDDGTQLLVGYLTRSGERAIHLAADKAGIDPTKIPYYRPPAATPQAPQSFIGKQHVLEDTTMYVKRDAYKLEFYAYERMGIEAAEFPAGEEDRYIPYRSLPKLRTLESLKVGTKICTPSIMHENAIVIMTVDRVDGRTASATSEHTFASLQYEDDRGWVVTSTGNTEALKRVDFT